MKTTPPSPRRPRLTQPAFFGSAAATGALFALQHHADAAIIYSGPQNITATFAGNFGHGSQVVTFGPSPFDLSVARMPNGAYVIGQAAVVFTAGGVLLNGSRNLKKLAAGAVISGAQFGTGGASVGFLRVFHNGNPVFGTWASAQTGFAAVLGNDGDFGWLRLKWTNTDGNPDPNTLTLVDSAYNDVPGQSIQAGQTSATPEPSSAALLALAGAGAAALRRRRA
jgi:hypothetical protein